MTIPRKIANNTVDCIAYFDLLDQFCKIDIEMRHRIKI